MKKELEAVNCKLAEKAIAEAFGAEHGQLKRAFEELSGQFQDQTQLLELKNDELVRVQKHYDELKVMRLTQKRKH